MQKKLFLIAIFSLVFVLILFIIILRVVKKEERLPEAPVPTSLVTTPGVTFPLRQTDLSVVSTKPTANSQEVALNTTVVINFNRVVTTGEVQFEFTDEEFNKVNYSSKITGKQITLVPQPVLEQSRVYTIKVMDRFKRLLYQFEFLTLTVAPSPDTRPIAALTQTIIRTRKERPDVYLANLMPYQSYDFAMELEIREGGYFNFVVTSDRLGESLLKSRVEEWLLSLELTSEQIKDLPLEYR